MHQNPILEDKRKFEQDVHDHHNTDPDQLDRTLFATLEALNEEKISYALIGGVAVKGLGRPRVTNDIDIFVSPDDAEKVLQKLSQRGFEIERRDPHWLYKAWREDVLVDIIFKSTGDIYFDDEIKMRVRTVLHRGQEIKTVSPEDFIVIKSAVHQEHTPHHWHDALAVLTHEDLDWDYLVRRARHAPRRVLSLLIYGQSNDLPVPEEAVRRLFRSLYDSSAMSKTSDSNRVVKMAPPPNEPELYVKGRIRESLARDARTADHDLDIFVSKSHITARGEVYNQEQLDAVKEVLQRVAPTFVVDNQIKVRVLSSPVESEAVV